MSRQKCYHMQWLLKTHWRTIFQDRKCIQRTISIPFFGFYFCWSGWLGSFGSPAFTHVLIHANFSSHTASSPLPSPPTVAHDSLSLHHLCIQGGHLYHFFHLFLSLFLLNSNEKVVEAWSALSSLGSLHTNSNCSQNPQTHWTLHLYIYR